MSEMTGTNGTISFDGRVVRIVRKGFRGFVSGNVGEKVIPLSSVTGVEFKASGLTLGYVQVSQPGHTSSGGRNRNKDHLKDENTVLFRGGQNEAARAVADEINAALVERG